MDEGTVQRLLDEKQIVDVMNTYTTALDTRDWDLLASCFTPDGDADFGNIAGVGALDTPQAVVDLCRGALQNLQATQHLQGNYAVAVDGDTATASCNLQANHFMEGAPGGGVFTVWGKYTDRFVRTADGWKIQHRDLRSIYAGGNLSLFNEAAEMAGQAAPTPA